MCEPSRARRCLGGGYGVKLLLAAPRDSPSVRGVTEFVEQRIWRAGAELLYCAPTLDKVLLCTLYRFGMIYEGSVDRSAFWSNGSHDDAVH